MPNVELSQEDLNEQLNRQLTILAHYLESYLTEPYIALEIATKIRVLCHDTKRQNSLINQLGLKDNLKFKSTFYHKSPSDVPAPFCGLVYVNLNYSGACFIPKLDQQPDGIGETDESFAEWWETEILRDYMGNSLTRRSLVLEMADTDGGSHVDKKLKEDHHYISRRHSLTWEFFKNGQVEQPVSGAELASVCQIGYELLSTLKQTYAPPKIEKTGMLGEFSMSGNLGYAAFGKPLPFRMEMSKNAPKGKERNLICECGSGRKAKVCCPQGIRVYVTTDPIG